MENGELLLHGHRGLFGEEGNFLEMDSGDD